MCSEKMKMKAGMFSSCADAYALALRAEQFDALRLGIGTRAASKIDGLAPEVAPELRNVGVVAIEEGDAVGGQRLDKLIFRPGDAGNAVRKILGVRVAHVCDDSPVGSGNGREGSDLSGA